MIKIRLARQGVKNRPFYQIVVSDSRSPRNGYFIERVGYFNPIGFGKEELLHLNLVRIKYWLSCGAVFSDRMNELMRKHKRNSLN